MRRSFWNVSTRPASARGGYGCSIQETDRRLAFLERHTELLTESPSSHELWRKLVMEVEVRGVAVHDARLVSVMLAEVVTSIVTLNEADFQRYEDIVAVTPMELRQTQ
jgi:predicted nucleic acid-binding protein